MEIRVDKVVTDTVKLTMKHQLDITIETLRTVYEIESGYYFKTNDEIWETFEVNYGSHSKTKDEFVRHSTVRERVVFGLITELIERRRKL